MDLRLSDEPVVRARRTSTRRSTTTTASSGCIVYNLFVVDARRRRVAPDGVVDAVALGPAAPSRGGRARGRRSPSARSRRAERREAARPSPSLPFSGGRGRDMDEWTTSGRPGGRGRGHGRIREKIRGRRDLGLYTDEEVEELTALKLQAFADDAGIDPELLARLMADNHNWNISTDYRIETHRRGLGARAGRAAQEAGAALGPALHRPAPEPPGPDQPLPALPRPQPRARAGAAAGRARGAAQPRGGRSRRSGTRRRRERRG